METFTPLSKLQVKMSFKEKYQKNGIEVLEDTCSVSDGVILKIYDFIPEKLKDRELPVVVFVAGWISHISGWHDVLNILAKTNRVLYVETREKKSAVIPEKSDISFDMKRLVQDLKEVVESKIKYGAKFYFAGSSLGSMIVLAYLAENGLKPVKSMLISPIATMEYPLWGKIIIKYFPASLYLVIKYIVAWYFTNIKVDKHKEPEQALKYEGTIKDAEPSRLKKNAGALSGYSLLEVVEKIDTEVLFIGAKTDKVHGTEVIDQLCGLIPSSGVVLLESNKATHGRAAGELINKIISGC